MAILGLSNRQQLIIFVVVGVIAIFSVWAMVDFMVNGYKGNYLSEDNLNEYWIWMWGIGVPVTGLLFAGAYIAGAPDTDENILHAFGIFSTVVILAVGQLEDFLYFVYSSLFFGNAFPTDDWWWMLFYDIFGTWTTEMHLVTVGISITVVCVMWAIIFNYD